MYHFKRLLKLNATKRTEINARLRFLNSYSNKSLSQLGVTFNQKPPRSSSTQSTQLKSNVSSSSFKNLGKLFPFTSTSSSSSASLSKTKFSSFLFDEKTTQTTKQSGLFGKNELLTHDGFTTLKDKAAERVKCLIDEAFTTNDSPQRKLVEIFDDISNELCCVADLAEFVRTTHPDAYFREAANLTFSAVSQIVEKLNTNYELYARLKNSLERPNSTHQNMDECDKRVCKLFLIDFEQSGIHLSKKKRDLFVDINDQLINLLMRFQIGSQEASQVSSRQVESKFKDVIRHYQDPITIETMFINSDDELFREFVYKTYLQSNQQQESIFRQILVMRQELARVCGFETYSHRANLNMIIETPENVIKFLDECSSSIWSKAEREFDLMRAFKKTTLKSDTPLMPWDVPIISNSIKKKMFNLDKSDYMNYFSLGSCMEGLNLILNHLYDVRLEVVKLDRGEAWHDDIYKLAVHDARKGLLGYIYCDFYQRSEKFSNVDCHYTIQCSKQLENGTYQMPIVVLHLNYAMPVHDRPTLLTFEMMENLFHEFGHAMHSMFAKTRYQHVSGTRCSTDFAEVPSQLMEYYCRDPRVVKLFAKHYATNETIDDRTLNKLCESKKMFAASDLQTQVNARLSLIRDFLRLKLN